MTARCTRRFGLLLWPLSSGSVSSLWERCWSARASGVDTAACGPPQRILLALGGPLILCAAGLWAFLRTYRVWRAEGTWWGWHGAGWFLLTLMVLTLCIGVPPIAGPVMAP